MTKKELEDINRVVSTNEWWMLGMGEVRNFVEDLVVAVEEAQAECSRFERFLRHECGKDKLFAWQNYTEEGNQL